MGPTGRGAQALELVPQQRALASWWWFFSMLFRLVILAIIASFLPWPAIALAPLAGLSLAGAAGFVGAALVAAEVLLWGGLAFAGKDTWQAVRATAGAAPRARWRDS